MNIAEVCNLAKDKIKSIITSFETGELNLFIISGIWNDHYAFSYTFVEKCSVCTK